MTKINFNQSNLDTPGLDLHAYLVRNPVSTFFVRASGEGLKQEGIASGDILVVDRSLPGKIGSLALIVHSGTFSIQRIQKKQKLEIWGIVTYIIHAVSSR